jgi:hypothetical protein
MEAERKERTKADAADFDEGAWTRLRRDAMYETTKGMSAEELVAYVRQVAAFESDPPVPEPARGPA